MSEVLVDVEQHEFRHLESQSAGDLSAEKLGDQGLRTVAGTAELHHIAEAVGGLGERRETAPSRSGVT